MPMVILRFGHGREVGVEIAIRVKGCGPRLLEGAGSVR